MREPTTKTRREALAAAGVLGLGAAAIGRGSGVLQTELAAAQTGSCVLTPEVTQGPYYINTDLIRRNITQGKRGLPLRLVLRVQDVDACTAVRGATVEIWHADSQGAYSGYNQQSTTGTQPPPGGGGGGGQQQEPTTTSRWLRGGQRTDRRGRAVFDTVYPGWYEGRSPHIHVRVHVGGDEVHTGQIFFPDELSAAVYGRGVYASRGDASTTNAADSIYAQAGGDAAIPVLQRRSNGGYLGRLTLNVQAG